MQKAKETASNVASSAKAGMDKTKATVQEKVERMTAHNSVEKEMATERKEAKISRAEQEKQEVRQHNAATRQAASAGGTYRASTQTVGGLPTTGTGSYTHSTTGAHGVPTGTQQMSALPGHGTGQPTGQVVEGTGASHPMGAGGTTSHNTHVGGNQGGGYGTGGGTY